LAVAPHTTNWDFILGLLVKYGRKVDVNFIGKHQLFRPPFGFLFRAVGGRPVYRHKQNNLVEEIADIFKKEKKFILGLAPEGTRSKVKRLKTGFYHIAQEANIPVVTAGIDFKNKTIIINSPYYLTGNKDKDMQVFVDFFKTVEGKYPELGIDENTTW
jgi:1-acyl-sn-glycerol-3-phosphate acyltransferase